MKMKREVLEEAITEALLTKGRSSYRGFFKNTGFKKIELDDQTNKSLDQIVLLSPLTFSTIKRIAKKATIIHPALLYYIHQGSKINIQQIQGMENSSADKQFKEVIKQGIIHSSKSHRESVYIGEFHQGDDYCGGIKLPWFRIDFYGEKDRKNGQCYELFYRYFKAGGDFITAKNKERYEQCWSHSAAEDRKKEYEKAGKTPLPM